MNHILTKQTEYKSAENYDQQATMADATPMMKQYFEIKSAYPDYLLFYRMGDFYELFFDDAVEAAGILDITLTRRGKHQNQDIPMCGVPFHSYESYLEKLIHYGKKVAICEQAEDPAEAKKRGAKSVVKREVVRVVTPGTVTEDNLLDAKESNYLAAFTLEKKRAYIAWADISAGDFYFTDVAACDLQAELARIHPKELLCVDSLPFEEGYVWLREHYAKPLTPFVKDFFGKRKTTQALQQFYGVTTLEPFGLAQHLAAIPCGALIEYLKLTQLDNLPHLDSPTAYHAPKHMVIDAATRRNLELSRTMNGEYKGSLLHTINRTATGPGARLLAGYLHSPLTEKKAIIARQDAIHYYGLQTKLRGELRNLLRATPDMERALARLSANRGGPRDLLAIKDALEQSVNIYATSQEALEPPDLLNDTLKQLNGLYNTLSILASALNDQVPYLARDGGFIREGYDKQLDEYRYTESNSDTQLEHLRERYVRQSGINSLKIKSNNVIGYFIEITPQHLDKIPENFVHRQTLASAVRFTTSELRELEEAIVHAKSNALARELELFSELRSRIMEQYERLLNAARSLARLDVMTSLAELAEEKGYTRPAITDDSTFEITNGRHPVVETVSESAFIGNDCTLSATQKIWLMTGPNMAGKSTFLRQNALIAILAQIGCYVPADSATIGLVDRVFSRVGAADDLARGQSTFMVEMVETATILNQATERSLVILDEIGRGTATFDGLSIAWAVMEYLHDTIQCRTLFATHYHELTQLSDSLKSLSCRTIKVREWKGEVVFLHEVVEGVAGKSYGIQVAKLAGIPRHVIRRAEQLMQQIEAGQGGNLLAELPQNLPLFASTAEHPSEENTTETHTALLQLEHANLDEMSPKEALTFLYALKEQL